MFLFILRRLFLLIPVLLGLSMLIFAIARLLPGDPAMLAAGPNATPADVERLRHELGLTASLPMQYFTYLSGLVTGDWGQSIFTRRPVLQDISSFLPATLELVIAAMILAVAIGIPAGLAAAVYQNKWPDYLTRSVSLGAIAMPRFFLGLVLQLLLATWLGLLPLGGRFPITETMPPFVTGFLTIDSLLSGNTTSFLLSLQYLALPALTTCLSPLATITRMMRASTLEVLQQDYVLTARALGLTKRKIVFKYVLKNAVSSTLTVIGLYFGWLLGGTVLVETVFDWPGIGLYATQAVLTQDFMPVVGVTLMIGVLFVSANLIIDILYGLINPKVRLR